MKEYRQEQDQDHLPGCDQGLWSRTAIWRGTPDVEGLQIHSAWRRHVVVYPDIRGKHSQIALVFGWLLLNSVQFDSKRTRVVLLPGRIFGLLTSENCGTINQKITPETVG